MEELCSVFDKPGILSQSIEASTTYGMLIPETICYLVFSGFRNSIITIILIIITYHLMI